VDTRIRRGFVIAGPIVFGVSYLVAAGLTTSDDVTGNEIGLVPLVGAFIAAATLKDVDEGLLDFDFSGVHRAGFILSGIGQTTGLILFIVGLTAKRQVMVRDDVGLVVTPFAGPRGAGIGLSGAL
jgi:hypothetical protein